MTIDDLLTEETPVQKDQAYIKRFVKTLPGIVESCLIGSSVYLPNPKDIDVLILVRYNAQNYAENLISQGWASCASEEYDLGDSDWHAVRKGNFNLIITDDADFYKKFRAAMLVCQYLKIESKEQRIKICRIVRDGHTNFID